MSDRNVSRTYKIHVEGANKITGTKCGAHYMEMFSWEVEITAKVLKDGLVILAEDINKSISNIYDKNASLFHDQYCEQIASTILEELYLYSDERYLGIRVRVAPGVPSSGRYVEAIMEISDAKTDGKIDSVKTETVETPMVTLFTKKDLNDADKLKAYEVLVTQQGRNEHTNYYGGRAVNPYIALAEFWNNGWNESEDQFVSDMRANRYSHLEDSYGARLRKKHRGY